MKKCYFCPSIYDIEEHHISYFKEEIKVVLCKDCHVKLHIIIKEYHKQIKQKDEKLKMISQILDKNYENIINEKDLQILDIIKLNVPRSKKVQLIYNLKGYSDKRSARRLLSKIEIKQKIEGEGL